MSCITECAPCQAGEHDRHYRVVAAVPKGTMGGAICPCEGECVERGPRPDPNVETIRQMFAESGPNPREVVETEYVAEAILAASGSMASADKWAALTSYERDQWREMAVAAIAAVRRVDRDAAREGKL